MELFFRLGEEYADQAAKYMQTGTKYRLRLQTEESGKVRKINPKLVCRLTTASSLKISAAEFVCHRLVG